MNKISIQTLVGDINEEPYLYFALKAVEHIADEYVIINAGSKDNENMKYVEKFVTDVPVKIIHFPLTTFSECRDVALKNTDCDWVLRVDCDEVHFRSVARFKDLIRRIKGVTRFRFFFYHFMIDYDHIEEVYPKNDILFKRTKDTHYDGKVHEHLSAVPKGLEMERDYKMAHYGYVKDPLEVFKRWELYAKLEGNPDMNKQLLQECGGPENILEHRKKDWQKFEFSHPEVLQDFVKEGGIFKSKIPGKVKYKTPAEVMKFIEKGEI